MNLSALFDTRYRPHIARKLKARTVAEYTRLARTIVLPKFGEREIDSFQLEEIEDWHATVPGKVQANRALALLSAMLGYAVKRRLLAINPCRGITRNRERNREFFYAPGECRQILAAASSFPDIRGAYIAICLLTGCRPGELLESGPSWRHGSVLRVPDSKTGVRVVCLPPAACAILDGLTPYRGARGEWRYFPDGMDLRRAWERILRDSGVPVARIYDLRHTFASSALAAQQSLAVVGQLLGHKKYQTTLRYAHLSQDVGLEGAAAAVARMGVGT